jgi:hypothetical protein
VFIVVGGWSTVNFKTFSIDHYTAILTTGAAIFAGQQWFATRQENSMDKYFDRRELANARLDQWEHAKLLVAHFWGDSAEEVSYQESMYVYVELDNLEYILEKYYIGYIDYEQTWRGLNTFISRCVSSEFRTLAMHHVRIAGYNRSTREAVDRIIGLWRN